MPACTSSMQVLRTHKRAMPKASRFAMSSSILQHTKASLLIVLASHRNVSTQLFDAEGAGSCLMPNSRRIALPTRDGAPRIRPSRGGLIMSDCLHCQINDLVEQQIAGGENDPLALASKIAESLADLILSVPQSEQALMIAEVLSQFGHVMLEKSGVIDDGSSDATH